MNKVLLVVGLSMTGFLALAGERVDQTLDMKLPGRVSIEHQSGHARIHGWDKPQVQVVGELDDRADGLEFIGKENEVRIRVKMPKSNWGSWGNDKGDDLDIYVPRESFVEYQSVNAQLKISDVKGGTDLSTVNGDINMADLAGRIHADAVNGDLRSERLNGDIRLETVNGDIHDSDSQGEEIRYESVNGDIHANSSISKIGVETVNGDAEFKFARVEKLILQTVSGDAEVQLQLSDNGEVDIGSVSGSVDLLFEGEVSATFDLESHAGGNFRNKLTADKPSQAKYGPARWLKFSTGTGTARVEASTVSGRVTLDKR
ncbi:DUF4097 family beta strand repeat-containing protein [Aliiglaciecola sp. CAU 1673]|uniref:DUF4097 family beta strand repeat-containing protein n=1 Tax=Aliiglaciecola sp. CAU 1673 TaxID=3032595 RepID=UPI0023DACCAC|nr:DUF4097 family beta strand repeat-containing protein [Aliiglaciecola sp. CAU 1673]MDF2180312.1 DUF4097 family beta strand repeat-containing protein [Aliiglaciecola sp. CAU 1673]